VAVAFRVDTAGSAQPLLAKAVAGKPETLPVPAQGRGGGLSIHDEGDGEFEIVQASLTVHQLDFLVGESEEIEEKVSQLEHIRLEDGAVVVEGPFRFDAIAGTVTPSLEALELPAAEYTGMRVHIGSREPSLSGTHAVKVRGIYSSANKQQEVLLGLYTDIRIMYPLEQSFAQGCEGCTQKLDVLLDANGWFRGVDLGPCLKASGAGSSMVIDSSTTTGRCKRSEALIRRNILTSGRLRAGVGPKGPGR
jgi:hypothetical protein